ncbi:MAG: hypothetical protein EBS05_05140 [Proteobacteria bacterium]|nr:hypothetical protein [Pseudomonadota bacterium]
MTLSTLCLALGVGVAVPNVYGLMNPATFRSALRGFARNTGAGYVLMAIATAWFLLHVRDENIADFASFKPMMYAGFGLLGVGTCLYLKDFLAVRGLALVLMLLAKFVLDTQRWQESNWRWVLGVWAYIWIVAGIWFTVSPWRCRDFFDWKTANDTRLKIGCALHLALGVLVAVLGVTVFKQ